jgi:hypothetical protein
MAERSAKYSTRKSKFLWVNIEWNEITVLLHTEHHTACTKYCHRCRRNVKVRGKKVNNEILVKSVIPSNIVKHKRHTKVFCTYSTPSPCNQHTHIQLKLVKVN